MSYPLWKEDSDKVSHFFYDCGFSENLLTRTQAILVQLLHDQTVVIPPSIRNEIMELATDLIAFKLGRLPCSGSVLQDLASSYREEVAK